MRAAPALCVLSPGTLAPGGGASFARRALALFARQPVSFVLREPALCERELLDTARAIAPALAEKGELVLHDRVHLARAAGAHAVQLGFRSLPAALARAQLPASIAVGFSAHEDDDPAAWEGADRLLFGPVRATRSKQGLVEPAGFDGLERASRAAGARPLWAIGGMRPEDAERARAAGAHGLATLSGVWSDREPERALARYLGALGGR